MIYTELGIAFLYTVGLFCGDDATIYEVYRIQYRFKKRNRLVFFKYQQFLRFYQLMDHGWTFTNHDI